MITTNHSFLPYPLALWLRWLEIVGFLRFIGRRLLADRCIEVAASLTFTTLLSFVPLITLTLIVASAFPVFSAYSDSFKQFLLENLVPDSATRIITVYMRQFSDNAGKLTAAGLAMLALTAISLMLTIERTFNAIWRVKKSRPLARQMLLYWTVLTLGPLLLGLGLSLTNGLSSPFTGKWRWIDESLSLAGSASLSAVVLLIVYGLIPNRFVPWPHALIGAITTAILLTFAKLGFALYVEMARSYQLIYGAFASFPILLLWLQLMWLLVLFGAELTAGLGYWQHRAWQRPGGHQQRFQDALNALVCLAHAQQHGHELKQADFRAHLHTGYDEIGHILDCLEHAKLITRTQNEGWVLLRQPDHIRLDALYDVFMMPTLHKESCAHDQALRVRLNQARAALAVSLQHFISESSQTSRPQ